MSQVNEAPAAGVVGARALRADARRNREELLVRAAEVFTERGVDASLEEIARRANVGIGTLYRHFPTRADLVAATYQREVETLCDGIDELLAEHPPDDALGIWMRSFAVYVSRKRGMAMALKSVLGADSTLFTDSHRRMQDTIATLLDAAVAAGSIRADVAPNDLLRAMGGICMATDQPGWSDGVDRMVGLLIDGLRYGAPDAAGAPAVRQSVGAVAPS